MEGSCRGLISSIFPAFLSRGTVRYLVNSEDVPMCLRLVILRNETRLSELNTLPV